MGAEKTNRVQLVTGYSVRRTGAGLHLIAMKISAVVNTSGKYCA